MKIELASILLISVQGGRRSRWMSKDFPVWVVEGEERLLSSVIENQQKQYTLSRTCAASLR